jgi:beta-lactamase class A
MATMEAPAQIQPASPAPADRHPFAERRAAATKLVSESGAEVSVAYRSRDGSEEWWHEADRVFHAASTMKVAVMVELFRQAEAGLLKLSDEIPVRNEFKSVVDGSTYSMEFEKDSDDTVYRSVGTAMTLEALNFQMITVSSNFATNLLIDRLGVNNIRNTVLSMGAHGLEVRRGVEDQKAFDRGIINETTARGLFVVLNAIARGQAVSKVASDRMVEVLAAQKFNDGIPAGLPPDTKVAHKTGTITRVHHDAGIVYGSHQGVLVVLTRGIEKETDSDALIARITRALFQ